MTPFGDDALRIDLPAGVDRAAALAGLLAWPGVRDAVFADTTAAVFFDPGRPPSLDAWRWPIGPPTGRAWPLAVQWDGPDRDTVGSAWIDAVTQLELEVKFLGFFPGFAYLGELPDALRHPRRATPRPSVPRGAVATAGPYLGIYPGKTPGGWQWVGTLVGELPALAPGDLVRWR